MGGGGGGGEGGGGGGGGEGGGGGGDGGGGGVVLGTPAVNKHFDEVISFQYFCYHKKLIKNR